MASKTDPSTVSAAVLRLDPLLRKIRDGLSQFLEAFALAIHGARRQDIEWPLFTVVMPDPGDGGTIDLARQQAEDFVNFDNFCIYRFNIPISEADIETAASYLRHCGLDPDAQQLLEVFKGLKAAFCSTVEFIPLSDGSTANRKFYAQDRALMLSEQLEELIRTLPTILTGGGAGQRKTAPPRRPPRIAFQAWYVRDVLGFTTQQQIADEMTRLGSSATQGQVSKWLAAVEEYLRAGGLMPALDELNKPDTDTVDPAVIDMGARQDGVTPRQRPRRDDDADSSSE